MGFEVKVCEVASSGRLPQPETSIAALQKRLKQKAIGTVSSLGSNSSVLVKLDVFKY